MQQAQGISSKSTASASFFGGNDIRMHEISYLRPGVVRGRERSRIGEWVTYEMRIVSKRKGGQKTNSNLIPEKQQQEEGSEEEGSWSIDQSDSGEAEIPISAFDKAFKISNAPQNFLKSLDYLGDKRVVEVITYQESEEEEVFCTCGEGEHGEMIQCENPNCMCSNEWYHLSCVGLKKAPGNMTVRFKSMFFLAADTPRKE